MAEVADRLGVDDQRAVSRQIGAEAARLLLERIADRTRPSAQITFSPTLVTRRTTGPPPS